MDRKTITLLVISNRKGVMKRVVVPVAWVKAAVLALFIGFIVCAVTVVDYVGLLVQSVEIKRLKAENIRLQNQFQLVEGKVDSLEKALERLKTFSTKLKLITSTEDPDRGLKLAVGPLSQPGRQLEEMEVPLNDRAPASVVAKQDSIFTDAPVLDIAQGELAAQDNRDYASLSVRIDLAVKETQLAEQGVLDLWDNLSGRQSLLFATPAILPAKGWFTSKFGYRISPYTGRPVMHQGLDIAAAPGSPVYAPADGIISFAGFDGGYGKLIAIDHGYGVTTRFGHHSQIYVIVGQKIKRGEVIGAVGNTGQSTGPHLHYEVRLNGVPVDPVNYILNE